MRDRKIVIYTFLLSFLLGVAFVGTGKASPALTFGCDPDVTIDIDPAATFDVYITAFEVNYLFLAEYRLNFDPAIISTDVANINFGDDPGVDDGALDNILIETVVGDEIHIVAGRPIGVKTGLSGDIQTVKITFTVVAEGSCGLYLYDVRLKNVAGEDLAIDRIIDGFFASSGDSHYAFACNSTGGHQNAFAEGETVYVVGGAFTAIGDVDLYVVPNAMWTDGDPIGASVLPVVTVTLLRKVVAPHLKFYLPLTALGVPPADYYDIVVDHDQDGIYDAAVDGVDEVTDRPGFTGSGIPEVPEFPFGVSVIMLLAPIIPLAYLWRLRRKVIKR